MNKEQLIALGLTEEQADKVVTGFGSMIPKSRFDEKNDEVKDLKTQIVERDTQLEELKKVDAAGLQDKITELQQANVTAQQDHDTKLSEVKLSSAIQLALSGKVQDAEIVANLIDKTKIELNENGTVKNGLDEQIDSLKASKPFLFTNVQIEIGNPSNPGQQGNAEPITKEQFNKMTYNERLKVYDSTPELFKKLTQSE